MAEKEKPFSAEFPGAFARVYDGERVERFSAASRPPGKINPKVAEAMREAGCDLFGHRSKSIYEIPDGAFDFVAMMRCGKERPIGRAELPRTGTSPTRKIPSATNYAPRAIASRVGSRQSSRIQLCHRRVFHWNRPFDQLAELSNARLTAARNVSSAPQRFLKRFVGRRQSFQPGLGFTQCRFCEGKETAASSWVGFGQTQDAANLFERKARHLGFPEEVQPPLGRLVVEAATRPHARRLGHEADPLIEPSGVGLDAPALCQSANEKFSGALRFCFFNSPAPQRCPLRGRRTALKYDRSVHRHVGQHAPAVAFGRRVATPVSDWAAASGPRLRAQRPCFVAQRATRHEHFTPPFCGYCHPLTFLSAWPRHSAATHLHRPARDPTNELATFHAPAALIGTDARPKADILAQPQRGAARQRNSDDRKKRLFSSPDCSHLAFALHPTAWSPVLGQRIFWERRDIDYDR